MHGGGFWGERGDEVLYQQHSKEDAVRGIVVEGSVGGRGLVDPMSTCLIFNRTNLLNSMIYLPLVAVVTGQLLSSRQVFRARMQFRDPWI